MKIAVFVSLGISSVSVSAFSAGILQENKGYYKCNNAINIFQVPYERDTGDVDSLWYIARSYLDEASNERVTHEANLGIQSSTWRKNESTNKWFSRIDLRNLDRSSIAFQFWFDCQTVGKNCSIKLYRFENNSQKPTDVSCQEATAYVPEAKLMELRVEGLQGMTAAVVLAKFAGFSAVGLYSGTMQLGHNEKLYSLDFSPASADVYGNSISFKPELYLVRPIDRPNGDRGVQTSFFGRYKFIGSKADNGFAGEVYPEFMPENKIGQFTLRELE